MVHRGPRRWYTRVNRHAGVRVYLPPRFGNYNLSTADFSLPLIPFLSFDKAALLGRSGRSVAMTTRTGFHARCAHMHRACRVYVHTYVTRQCACMRVHDARCVEASGTNAAAGSSKNARAIITLLTCNFIFSALEIKLLHVHALQRKKRKIKL